MAGPDQFKHSLAQCGETQVALLTQGFSSGQGVADTVRVVVWATGQRHIGSKWFEHQAATSEKRDVILYLFKEAC